MKTTAANGVKRVRTTVLAGALRSRQWRTSWAGATSASTLVCVTDPQTAVAEPCVFRPGDYETVRRILGHRNIQTTIDFYCGLQTMEATQQFGKLIRENIQLDDD